MRCSRACPDSNGASPPSRRSAAAAPGSTTSCSRKPRALLRSIPGLDLAEPAEPAICCGSAGIYNLVQPDAAAELGARKAQHVAATGADVYASANPGCLLQVSAALRRAGQARPALHPVELLDASLRGGLHALHSRE